MKNAACAHSQASGEPRLVFTQQRAPALNGSAGERVGNRRLKGDFGPAPAHRAIELDEELGSRHRETYAKIRVALIRNPEDFSAVISYLGVSRHLERIADYATNIAEDVIYMTDGEIVRHQTDLAKEIT
ncbi:MAG: hypothetical protein JXB25_09005 [Deltaproteobacteria bacterium]|nr:hypothetical protein [Deltaproteobacteria bacterium]